MLPYVTGYIIPDVSKYRNSFFVSIKDFPTFLLFTNRSSLIFQKTLILGIISAKSQITRENFIVSRFARLARPSACPTDKSSMKMTVEHC
jgi:hypothetical protein